MKSPDRIWLSKHKHYRGDFYCAYPENKPRYIDGTTKYIRASLLKDDKWLADNGLKRFCKTCHGERKIPIFDKEAGGTYLSHYETCMDCQQINVSGF